MTRDLKGYECSSLSSAMGSVLCVASFGKTLAEITLLVAMAEC